MVLGARDAPREGILEGTLEMMGHQVHETEMVGLGKACREKGPSGFDIDSLVEGLVRKGLGAILVSGWFREIGWDDGTIVMPCSETEDGHNLRAGRT